MIDRSRPATAVQSVVWVPPLGGTAERLGYLKDVSVPVLFANLDAAEPDPGDPFASLSRIVQATAAVGRARHGVAMCRGASALARALLDVPDQFDSAVLIAPFAFSRARTDAADALAAIAAAAHVGDTAAIEAILLSTMAEPGRSTTAARAWAIACAHRYLEPATRAILPWLSSATPTGTIDLTTAVRPPTRVLVIGQPGDAVHPLDVAEEITAFFPNSTLHIGTGSADILARRAELDAVIGDFLAQGS
ncbi:hypothetical protein [Catenulispora pinisilvae]|uniref:hypothetical protein n=1 Tax=Catenulispora pinisilvae TaxID=2705253 RepID=UPI0018920BE7|nr:hypothetical protein [Catenulispora pinisilvae]